MGQRHRRRPTNQTTCKPRSSQPKRQQNKHTQPFRPLPEDLRALFEEKLNLRFEGSATFTATKEFKSVMAKRQSLFN